MEQKTKLCLRTRWNEEHPAERICSCCGRCHDHCLCDDSCEAEFEDAKEQPAPEPAGPRAGVGLATGVYHEVGE